jgi:hypothetical protein
MTGPVRLRVPSHFYDLDQRVIFSESRMRESECQGLISRRFKFANVSNIGQLGRTPRAIFGY